MERALKVRKVHPGGIGDAEAQVRRGSVTELGVKIPVSNRHLGAETALEGAETCIRGPAPPPLATPDACLRDQGVLVCTLAFTEADRLETDLERTYGVTEKKCSTDGCERERHARGLCLRCYVRAWKAAGGTGKRCSFEGCGKPLYSKGLCAGHYWQQRRGKELSPLRESVCVPWNPADDLRTKLETARDDTEPDENGCWNWKWGTNSEGYGCVYSPEFGQWSTHRASFHVFVRPIRSAEVIHHKCANRSCWNPEHLQATTAHANTAEMLERNNYLKEIETLTTQNEELTGQVDKLKALIAEHGLTEELETWLKETRPGLAQE